MACYFPYGSVWDNVLLKFNANSIFPSYFSLIKLRTLYDRAVVVVIVDGWIYIYVCYHSLSPLKLFESHPVEVHSIQHYMIKFVCDMRQVDGFLRYSGFLHQ